MTQRPLTVQEGARHLRLNPRSVYLRSTEPRRRWSRGCRARCCTGRRWASPCRWRAGSAGHARAGPRERLGERLADSGIFEPAYLRELVDEHQSGARDYRSPLWTLPMFDAFLRNVAGARGRVQLGWAA